MKKTTKQIAERFYSLFSDLRLPSENTLTKTPEKNVLIFVHTLYTGGSQMAVLEMARLFMARRVQPWVFSVHAGACVDRFVDEGVPCCIGGRPNNSEEIRTFFLDFFDAAWLNSVMGYYFSYFFINTKTPVFWWIHETKEALSGFKGFLPHPQAMSDNIRFAAPTIAVQEAIRELYQRESELLPLTIRDERRAQEKRNRVKVRFLIPGTYMPIKGYDLMLKAISMLPRPFREKSEYIFCGFTYPDDEAYAKQLRDIASSMDDVTMLGELTREELYDQYASSDCVVAPTRLDSGPMTIIEAMMFERLTIVSEAAGISGFMQDCVNGFVFATDQAEELLKRLLLVISDIDELQPIALNGRRLYEERFSPEATNEYLNNLLQKGGVV